MHRLDVIESELADGQVGEAQVSVDTVDDNFPEDFRIFKTLPLGCCSLLVAFDFLDPLVT